MEFGPDGIPTSDIGFITQIKKVFPVDEVTFPDDSCSLVAVAVRYGLVFCSNGNTVKVFQSQDLLGEGETVPSAIIDAGNAVTHVSASCDGLTLLVIILHDDKPKALFYDMRSLAGNDSPSPFAAKSFNGSRVQAVSWNPRDPCSVAIATSPGDLSVITVEDNRLDTKSKAIKACALSWSPKGKQLTVGLADGSLALFKPDLQLVRIVKSPPMDGTGAVQSLTWFSNTEFFIGYKMESEEGGQVIMYVNAPKAQEPRFVAYEFICNDNMGPLLPMFYQTFFQEWNILCLASSRAAQLGVLGTAEQGAGWCEYELEEGKQAVMHCINITETTYALGMAVDFTSQKVFTHKDGSTSGPCPVIYILSTGGELNIFHVVNSRQGVESLVLPPEILPKTGHRTAGQYQGSGSPLPVASKPAFAPVPATGLFNSSAPAKQTMSASGISLTPIKPKTSFESMGSTLGSLMFGTGTSQPTVPSFTTQAPAAVPLGGGSTFGNSSTIPVMGSVSGAFTQTGDNKGDQKIKLPQATALGGNMSQNKQPQVQLISTPAKPQTPSPVPSSPLPKANESQSRSKSQSPLTFPSATPAGKVVDDSIVLSVITSALAQFEEELQNHMSYQASYGVGTKEDMGHIRRSLTEESNWIEQMASTTSELMGEISQLHSEVLQGFKLREEADAQISKSKNPRHFMTMQSRQLDPRSRKMLEDIRSKYQYLQSQLEEVNTRLHLEWISYTNAIKNKKKRDLPITETIYNALMKCHTLRTRQEKDLELLCDRLKTLEVDSVSRGLRINRQHNNDDVLANLEKSLREVQLSPSAYISPVKTLSQSKQEKLQKILAQRNTIPVRKCAGTAKVMLSDLSKYSESSPQRNFQESSASMQSPSFSFGPQTCSTPNRQSKFLGYADLPETSFKSPSPDDLVSSNDKAFTASGLSNRVSGLFSSTSTTKEKSTGHMPLSTNNLYEDITPPQTPAVKSDVGSKSPSPLVALSSLVNNVQTKTTAADAAPSVSISESKPSLAEIHGSTFSIVSTSSTPIKFSFKPQSSSALGTILTSKTPISATLSIPPSTDISVLGNKGGSKILPQFTSANLSDSQVLSPSSVTGTQITITPLPKNTSSSKEGSSISSTGGGLFSPKPSSANSGLFSLSLPTSSNSLSSGLDSSSNKSSFTVFSSANSLSLFGSTLSSTVSVSNASLPAVTTTTFSAQNTKQIGTESSLFSGVSVSSSFKGTKESKDAGGFVLTTKTSSDLGVAAAVTATPKVSENNSSSIQGSDSASTSAVSGASSFGLFTMSKSPSATENTSTSSASGNNSIFGKPTGVPSVNTLFQSSSTGNTGLFAGSVTLSFTKSTEASATGSVFGGSSASAANVFETAKAGETGGIFGSTSSGSVFGAPQVSAGNLSGSVATTSVKSTEDTTSTTTLSSAGDVKTTTATSSSSGSLFGGVSSLASSSGGSIFGGATSTSSSGSVFGSTSATTTTSSNGTIFGTSTTTSGGSIFGGAPLASSSSSGNIFGGTATATTASGIFGSPSAQNTASGGSIFGGGSTQTTASSGSVFGGPAAPSTASGGSVFGGPAAPSTASGGSVFGGASTPATTPGGSIFGSASAPATTSSGNVVGGTSSDGSTMETTAFSSLAASSSGSGFGQQSAFGALSSPTTGSGFSSAGLNLNASATSNAGGSIFGQKPGSVFGQTTQSSSTPLFGGQSSTGSIFSGSQNQGGSVFGTSAPKGTSLFGGSAVSSGTSLFSPTAVTSTSNTSSSGISFGQPSSVATSPFASPSTTQGTGSLFSSSSFAMGSGSGGGGGGGFFSGLGSKPSEENANKNIFGSTSFTNTKPQLSLFGGGNQSGTGTYDGGQTNTSTFGTGQTSTTSTFGSPGFTGQDNSATSSGTVLQSGFGIATPPKSSGFGGSPTFGGSAVFGGSPAFGSSPKFGSSPSFGSTATFGSLDPPDSNKVNVNPYAGSGAGGGGGGGGSSGGFGGFASSGGTTFGSLASSGSSGGSGFGSFSGQNNTATFGGLAQQSPGQQQSPFGSSGNSFGGGSSFSTWRS